MAKIERVINKDFDQLLSTIENGIINGSVSASLEDASDFRSQDAALQLSGYLNASAIPVQQGKSQCYTFSKWRRACSPFCNYGRWKPGCVFQAQYFWGRGIS